MLAAVGAAHLHDSVLQTLALIQRHAEEPQAVSRLARSQERELRAWLYGERPPDERVRLSLTARRPDGSLADRQPLRVVVGQREISSEARVLNDDSRTMVIRTRDPHGIPLELRAWLENVAEEFGRSRWLADSMSA